jgi:hypothetical protein
MLLGCHRPILVKLWRDRFWPISAIVLPPITGFTLMADRKNQDGILIFLKAVERYIAGTSSERLPTPANHARSDRPISG